jgi:hypothetical protein
MDLAPAWLCARGAWLLHCKEQFGLVAPGSAPKENPCPPEKVAAIKQAFRRFGLLCGDQIDRLLDAGWGGFLR